MLSVNTSSLFYSALYQLPTNQPFSFCLLLCCTCQIKRTMPSNGSNSFHILLYTRIMLSYIVCAFHGCTCSFKLVCKMAAILQRSLQILIIHVLCKYCSICREQAFLSLISSLYLLYSTPLTHTIVLSNCS
jgi:hypothetical protein